MPLYHQIFLQLRDEIIAGGRPTGSMLPTEAELAAQFSVSRITAQRVLDELAGQGFAERRRRVGTRVTWAAPAPPIAADIDQAVDSLLAFVHGTQVRVLEVADEAAPPAVAEALRLAPGAHVVRAVRVRSQGRLPLGHILSYVPATLADVVTAAALAQTPMLELLEAAGHRAAHAEQTIGATLADTRLAAALAIEPRAALLRITRTSHDAAGVPMLLTIAHYRSDRFQIRLELNPR